MKTSVFSAAIVLLCGVVIPPSLAEDEVEPVDDGRVMAISLKATTLGYGLDVTFGLASQINTRLGINMFNFEPDVDDDEGNGEAEEIDVELNWQTIPVLFDWHPWSENFRFTLGAVVNNNEAVLSADIGESVEINDQVYTVSDLDGKITFDPVVPYVGLGWGNAVRGSRVKFAFDLGVMFQGEPEVELNATASNAALQGPLDEALEAEKAELEDDLEPFNMYPVISFGISVAF